MTKTEFRIKLKEPKLITEEEELIRKSKGEPKILKKPKTKKFKFKKPKISKSATSRILLGGLRKKPSKRKRRSLKQVGKTLRSRQMRTAQRVLDNPRSSPFEKNRARRKLKRLKKR